MEVSSGHWPGHHKWWKCGILSVRYFYQLGIGNTVNHMWLGNFKKNLNALNQCSRTVEKVHFSKWLFHLRQRQLSEWCFFQMRQFWAQFWDNCPCLVARNNQMVPDECQKFWVPTHVLVAPSNWKNQLHQKEKAMTIEWHGIIRNHSHPLYDHWDIWWYMVRHPH